MTDLPGTPSNAKTRLRRDVLTDMAVEVFRVNKDNGWFDSGRSFGEGIALLHSEVSEAFEAFRDHGFEDMTAEDATCVHQDECACLPKPEGVGSEMADILIRLLDECSRQDIDLAGEFARKLAYNRTRGYKHGGKSI